MDSAVCSLDDVTRCGGGGRDGDATTTQCMAFKYKKIYNSLCCFAFCVCGIAHIVIFFQFLCAFVYVCVSVSECARPMICERCIFFTQTKSTSSRWVWVSGFLFWFFRFFINSIGRAVAVVGWLVAADGRERSESSTIRLPLNEYSLLNSTVTIHHRMCYTQPLPLYSCLFSHFFFLCFR